VIFWPREETPVAARLVTASGERVPVKLKARPAK
jgi:hypothetical protein